MNVQESCAQLSQEKDFSEEVQSQVPECGEIENLELKNHLS